MKFTIETKVLKKLLRIVSRRSPLQKVGDEVLRLGASGAHAYAEANETLGAAEALVLEDGECSVAGVKVQQVLQTFSDCANVTLSADSDGLTVGRFTMPLILYTARPSHPAERLLQCSAATSRINEPAYPTEAEWSWFKPDALESLFSIYGRKSETAWAERKWQLLRERGLTLCKSAEDYTRVKVRLAVLAVFLRQWVLHAYGAGVDPSSLYGTWFTDLQLQAPESLGRRYVLGEDAMRAMIAREMDAVFSALISTYDDPEEICFALDLRHAAGIGDEFGEHVVLNGSTAAQAEFFEECGLSFREFDCLSLIGNGFA